MRPLGVELAAMLADRGVDTVFGIPGVHNVELYRGIEDAGLRHILARHEQGAGFMADGYARATGRPGVCFVISGPGLTNIMTPMGQAYSDSVPMLVIASVLDDTLTIRGQLHQMRDQEGAARTVCDWSETAETSEAAYALVDRALEEFQCDRKRPKAINLPIKLLSEVAEAPPERLSEFTREKSTNEADPTNDIIASKRPLFIFGGGARDSAAEANLVLERLGAASFTTYAGRGIVRPENQLHFGSYLARADSASVLASADLIVAVGTELASVDFWRDSFEADAPIIRVDIDPAVLNDSRGARDLIQSDARRFLTSLSESLNTHEADTEWTQGEVATARARWKAQIDADRPVIVPICDALRKALPKNTMFFSDMTQFAYAAKEVWDLPAPGLWHHPYGFG
ncbi:MAG: thiamine pyrophosphate-binding protein, partial [Boseongicola sp.]